MILFALLSWLSYATLRGSVVIVLAAILLAIAGRRIAARWRHALWVLVLVRLAVPFAPVSSLSIFNLFPFDSSVAAGPIRLAAAEAATPMIEGVRTTVTLYAPSVAGIASWIIAIWAGGVLLMLARMIIATIRVQRAVRIARRRNGERRDLIALTDAARMRLGIRRRVTAIECDAVKAPALHGLAHPTLLLPAGFGETFDARETRHVVLHELWHLKRHDIPLNWILSVVQVLHWFNPFVWYAISRIGEERELVCDELALSCLEEDERSSYGHTILKLLDRFRAAAPVPALVGIVNHKEMMKRRLTMIASFRNRTRFSILFLAAVALVAAVGFTDAARIERRVMKHMDGAELGALKPLHQQISFDLTNATLSDVLSTISNKTGVVLKQAPEIATSKAQDARFTIHADNVPAHAALHETLGVFGLEPQADGTAITIVNAPAPEAVARVEAEDSDDDHGIVKEQEERHLVIHGDAPDGDHVEEKMLMRHGGPEGLPASGKSHRELTFKLSENGKVTNGTMTVDIVAPPSK